MDTDRPSYKYALSIMVEVEPNDIMKSKMGAGDLFHQTPIPKNNEEAFERLRKLTGQRHFEDLQKEFTRKYATGNEYTINAELAPLNEFVLLAETAKPQDLYKEQGLSTDSIEHYMFEYLRIKHGFYLTNYCKYEDKNLDIIYGTYFLYKPWLESLLAEFSGEGIFVSKYPKKIKTALGKKKKAFHTFLQHPKAELLAIALKDNFKDEIGKMIKFLILALKEKNLIHYGNREFTSLYNSMKACFERNIGAIQGIRDFDKKPTSIAYQQDYAHVKNKLESILKELGA